MKGFAYLLVLFALVVFTIFMVNGLYAERESGFLPMAAFYEPTKARLELEAQTTAAAAGALRVYLLALASNPELMKEELSNGGVLLKRVAKEAVLLAHSEFASSYAPVGVNGTCFCAPYDKREFKAAAKESALKGLLYLPRESASLGVQCEDAVEVYVLNLSPAYAKVKVSLSENGKRFGCLAQAEAFANLALLKEALTVESNSSAWMLPEALNLSQ